MPGRRPPPSPRTASGLTPAHANPTGVMRRMALSWARPFAEHFTVYVTNRKPRLAPGVTMSNIARDYAQAITEDFGGPVRLHGTSTGGSVALQLAIDHPDLVQRMVVAASACRLSEHERRIQAQLAQLTEQGDTRRASAFLMGALAKPPLRHPARGAGWLLGGVLAADDPGDMLRTIDAEDTFDVEPELARVQAPTLVLRGGPLTRSTTRTSSGAPRPGSATAAWCCSRGSPTPTSPGQPCLPPSAWGSSSAPDRGVRRRRCGRRGRGPSPGLRSRCASVDCMAPGTSSHGVALRGVGAAVGAGVCGLAYAWWEARWFTVRHVTVPVLPSQAPDLRVLHVSDLHLTPYQRRKRAFIASLAALEPDLVVDTGDNLAHQDAVGPLLQALGSLTDRPGVFVLGSNDYYSPLPKNPARYLLPDDGRRNTHAPQLPWRDLVGRFSAAGWVGLGNRRATLEVRGVRIAFAGVDDPHLHYDDLHAVAGQADGDADLRVGVAHAPYLRVLDRFATDGYDLVLAGHTHGGQLRLPGVGALVSNCDLEPARARGLHRHPRSAAPGTPRSAWLHVSAGAGTSPYSAVRFCCRPEATLLTLTSR